MNKWINFKEISRQIEKKKLLTVLKVRPSFCSSCEGIFDERKIPTKIMFIASLNFGLIGVAQDLL